MTETTDQIDEEAVETASTDDTAHEESHEEPKSVPLAALQAERKKRQEAEAKIAYQEQMLREREAKAQEEVDPEGLVEHRTLQNATASTKREILETLYQDMNPKAVEEINTYLKPILEKKPWLASSVDTALNRYARAYEIVTDYKHLVTGKKAETSDAKRMVENAQKPRSPAEIGKSAQPTGVDFLKSIQGKKEFREYRQKLLRGET